MKRLIIHRKKKFASALMPYWIVTETDKKTFMEKYNLIGDFCKTSVLGHPISRIDFKILRKDFTIENGETIQIELNDNVTTAFAITMDGCLSNEIILSEGILLGDGIEVFNHLLTTRGGFFKPSYPWFEK
ncbi:MAG: hypothetical protein J6B75_09200 [Ruminococcus sp.]|nr:hypothetical protein [Ruminococcus sp.]